MTKHARSSSFLLLTENTAPQDALLSIESIEVRPFVPKGILSVRQTVIYLFLYVIAIPMTEAMKASGANLTKTNSNPCNIVPATANSGLL